MFKRILIFGLISILAVSTLAIKYKGGLETDNEVIFPEITTPGNPPSAKHKLYFKSDDFLYRLNSGGSESRVGGGVDTSGTPIALDYAKFTDADTVEGRSFTEMRTDLNVENNADVTDAANVASAGAVMDSDISEAEGFLRKTGAGAYEGIKSNLGATVDPTVNEDSGDGYAVGSVWINVTLDNVFQASDVTVAAAVWKDLSTDVGGGGFTLDTEQATTSGSNIDFTGLPAGIKLIFVLFNEVSYTGTNSIQIRIGDSGGFETTDYVSSSVEDAGSSGSSVSTTGAFIFRFSDAADEMVGIAQLARVNGSHLWVMNGTTSNSTTTNTKSGGVKTLTGELDRLQLRLSSGTFDNGTVNIMYE